MTSRNGHKHGSGVPRGVQPVADGVWRVRGGFLRLMNVYLVADDGGVLLFDAGTRSMAEKLRVAARAFGGVTRIVLSHSHVDHRGTAPYLGAPVWCHAAERANAEGDGGMSELDLSTMNPLSRRLMPRLWQRWDGGPVRIERTLEEGDEVAGFEVVHLPGHAPGQIAFWRRSDRLALSGDCFYVFDVESLRQCPPRPPPLGQDDDQMRESMRKLAALEPRAAWPGHREPLFGNVRSQLERAASRRRA